MHIYRTRHSTWRLACPARRVVRLSAPPRLFQGLHASTFSTHSAMAEAAAPLVEKLRSLPSMSKREQQAVSKQLSNDQSAHNIVRVLLNLHPATLVTSAEHITDLLQALFPLIDHEHRLQLINWLSFQSPEVQQQLRPALLSLLQFIAQRCKHTPVDDQELLRCALLLHVCVRRLPLQHEPPLLAATSAVLHGLTHAPMGSEHARPAIRMLCDVALSPSAASDEALVAFVALQRRHQFVPELRRAQAQALVRRLEALEFDIWAGEDCANAAPVLRALARCPHLARAPFLHALWQRLVRAWREGAADPNLLFEALSTFVQMGHPLPPLGDVQPLLEAVPRLLGVRGVGEGVRVGEGVHPRAALAMARVAASYGVTDRRVVGALDAYVCDRVACGALSLPMFGRLTHQLSSIPATEVYRTFTLAVAPRVAEVEELSTLGDFAVMTRRLSDAADAVGVETFHAPAIATAVAHVLTGRFNALVRSRRGRGASAVAPVRHILAQLARIEPALLPGLVEGIARAMRAHVQSCGVYGQGEGLDEVPLPRHQVWLHLQDDVAIVAALFRAAAEARCAPSNEVRPVLIDVVMACLDACKRHGVANSRHLLNMATLARGAIRTLKCTPQQAEQCLTSLEACASAMSAARLAELSALQRVISVFTAAGKPIPPRLQQKQREIEGISDRKRKKRPSPPVKLG